MSTKAPTHVDLNARLYARVTGTRRAVLETAEAGLIAGTALLNAAKPPADPGQWRIVARDGMFAEAGQVLVELEGTPAQLGLAEDFVLGSLGFASGIATRAKQLRDAAPIGLSLACGGWKKLPAALKPLLRAGLSAVGVLPRLVDGDFIYLSKNAVLMLGGVAPAIVQGLSLNHGPVAVQVKSVDEARFAADTGAGIIMVDTGVLADLADVHAALTASGQRNDIRLAFGGGVRLEDLLPAHTAGADAVDIGRAILDAPLLDLRMRILS